MAFGGQTLRRWLATTAAQILIYAQGIAVFPIVIRSAGQETYGAYVLVIMLLGFVFDFWTSGVPYRYRRNLVSTIGHAEVRRLFEPQFTFQVIALAATAAVLAIAAPALTHVLQISLPIAPWLPGAWLAAHLLYRLVHDYFRLTLRFGKFNLIVGGFPPLYMTFLVVFVLSGQRLTIDALLSLQTAAYFLISAPFAVPMLREIGVPRFRLPLTVLVEDFRSGFPFTVQLVLNFILASSDRYLLSAFIGVAAVGQYQPAYQLAWSVIFLPTVGYLLLSPSLWRLVDTGKRADAERLITIFNRGFLMIAIPFVTGALLVGPSILATLASPEIGRASAWVMPLVAAASVPFAVTTACTAVLIALNRSQRVFIAAIIGAGFDLAANLIFLPLFRTITEPAIATLLGYTASCIYMSWVLRDSWPIRLEWDGLVRFAAASGIMAVALCAIGFRPGGVISGAGVPSLIAAVAGAAVLYFGSLWLLGGFSPGARHDFATLARLGAAME